MFYLRVILQLVDFTQYFIIVNKRAIDDVRIHLHYRQVRKKVKPLKIFCSFPSSGYRNLNEFQNEMLITFKLLIRLFRVHRMTR